MEELSDEVIAFLSEGTRTGTLGYLASDGRPLVAPVWFIVDDGELVFNTGKNTAKGRALRRDTAKIVVEDPPLPGIEARRRLVQDQDLRVDAERARRRPDGRCQQHGRAGDQRQPPGLDLQAVLHALSEKGITRLLVEGGARVASSFVAAGLVDEVWLLRGPDAIGTGGVVALDALPLTALTESPAFKLRASEALQKDTLTIYERA